jgi:hypothetical protein
LSGSVVGFGRHGRALTSGLNANPTIQLRSRQSVQLTYPHLSTAACRRPPLHDLPPFRAFLMTPEEHLEAAALLHTLAETGDQKAAELARGHSGADRGEEPRGFGSATRAAIGHAPSTSWRSPLAREQAGDARPPDGTAYPTGGQSTDQEPPTDRVIISDEWVRLRSAAARAAFFW